VALSVLPDKVEVHLCYHSDVCLSISPASTLDEVKSAACVPADKAATAVTRNENIRDASIRNGTSLC